MRISWGKTLGVIALVAVVCAFIVFKPGADKPPAPTEASATHVASLPRTTVGASSSSPTPDEQLPSGIEQFVAIYSTGDGDDVQWLEQLRPLVTPALHASLSTSSREVAQASGSQILDADEGRVSVGSASGVAYVLAYERVDGEEGAAGEGGQVVVTGLDFTEPPPGSALPLDSSGGEQLRAPVQDALRVLIAQPGGWSDVDREQAIRQTFTEPEAALAIPRTASVDIPIKIGNAHELTPGEESGELAVYATVPYAVDGSTEPSWTTVTVLLARDQSGTWVPKDAWI